MNASAPLHVQPRATHDAEHALQSELHDKTLIFPLGIPGFPEDRRFVLTQTPAEAPFAWLNSVDTAGLSFIVIEPRLVVANYQFDVNDADLAVIGSPGAPETALLVICRIERQGDTTRLYANLRAPLLLNLKARLARQLILGDDTGFSEAHPIGA